MASAKIQKIVKSLDKKIRDLLKPDHFYVALYDTVKSELTFLWVLSKKEDVDEKARSYQPQRLPDQLIEKKKHWLVEENIEEQFEVAGVVYGPDDQQLGSWLGAPMIFEGRVLGVIVVESQVPGAFGDKGVRVMTTMARQTASAIENLRLYERMESINEIGQKLNSQIQLNESEILNLIHEEASKLIYADNMYIALYDESLDEIHFPIIYVGSKKIEVSARKLDRDKMGKTEYIILNEESLFHATGSESKAWYDQPGHADHIDNPLASWIGVPMKVSDKVIGVIAAYHEEDDYVYDEHDLLILQSMASQAAIALDNAALYEQSEDRANELRKKTNQLEKKTCQLEALQNIGVNITSQLDIEEVLGTIAENAISLMAADFSTLFVYDPNSETFRTGIRKGKIKITPSTPSRDGATGRIATSQTTKFVNDMDKFPELKPLIFDGQRVKAFAGVPLIIKKTTVGVLYVNYLEPHQFVEQEREIINLLASQAAVAIENARLYQQLENKIAELEHAQGEIANKERALVLTTVAADFVHRMNNLAGTIPNWVALAKRQINLETERNEQVLNYLDRITQDAKFLLKEALRLKNPLPEPELIDVEDLIGSIIGQMELITSPEIKFSIHAEKDLGYVQAIKPQLSDAFFNVIDNAVRAIKDEGKITITIKKNGQKDKYLLVSITDTGSGIKKEDIETIFDLNVTYRPAKDGMGYGLWRTRNIVEGIGGTINAKSILGEGSTFFINLPMYSDQSTNRRNK